jgi:hypothetical protein
MKTVYFEILSLFLIIISSIMIFYLLKLIFKRKIKQKSSPNPPSNYTPPPPRVPPSQEICNAIKSSNFILEKGWKGKEIMPSANQGWDFFVGTDPTHGHVSYDSWSFLLKPYGDSLRIDVDSIPVGKGRRSVRLITTDKYVTDETKDFLFIIDAEHIPEGLSVWPAFWLVGIPDELTENKYQISNWACYGEIDIIEGVNSVKEDADSNINLSSLHTNKVVGQDDCIQGGVLGINNFRCDASSSDLYTCGCNGNERCPNIGCSQKKGLFGNSFNNSGGGVYTCQLISGQVTIWFFPRNNIPNDIMCGKPDPSSWPNEDAVARNKNAGITISKFNPCSGHFKNLMLVLNTTICGEFAGSTFKNGSDTGLDACEAFSVDPDNTYSDAFWYINYIKIFTRATA